jgi:hypothetical protein
MHAPVSVGRVDDHLGFFSARYASASASTSRPSASVFSTLRRRAAAVRQHVTGLVADSARMFSEDGSRRSR